MAKTPKTAPAPKPKAAPAKKPAAPAPKAKPAPAKAPPPKAPAAKPAPKKAPAKATGGVSEAKPAGALSLAEGDAIAAKGATAPRVSLDSMNAKVRHEYYETADFAMRRSHGGKDHPALAGLTICILVLDNGWTLLGTSKAVAGPNFDPEKGRLFARENALKGLWEPEGYLLAEKLHQEQLAASAPVPEPAAAEPAPTPAPTPAPKKARRRG